MSAPDFSSDEMRRRLDAAELLARRLEGTTSASDDVACGEWRSQDPRNEQIFQETEALLQALCKLPRSETAAPARRPRQLGWTVATIIACFAGLWFIGAWLKVPDPADPPQQYQQYMTALAEWSDRTLPDGSKVSLGPSTQLRFAMTESQRIVYFDRGEALFAVTKDQRRKFVVKDGANAYEAVGTSFAVSKFGGPAQVTVQEGNVRVSRNRLGDAPINVSSGQQVTVVPRGRLNPGKADLDSELAWVKRKLILNGLTMGQAVAEFNQRNNVQIQIDGASMPADAVLEGWMPLNDPTAFAESLARTYNFVIDRQRPNVLRLMAATRPATK